jgi:hypothetical protein
MVARLELSAGGGYILALAAPDHHGVVTLEKNFLIRPSEHLFPQRAASA